MTKITLRAARINAGLTQDDMAGRLGVSRGVINEWECGRKPIRPAYVYAYCQLTGFQPDDLDQSSFFVANETVLSGREGGKK